MRRLADAVVSKLEALSGLPGRFIVPVVVSALSLLVAVLGMYWDIGYHIDHGRDQGVLTLPHLFIVAGLQGLFLAVVLHGLMRGPRARGERSLPGFGLSLAPGGWQALACSGIALLGFPLDALWHALFGEDVTLWGPTHLFMIGGAGASTLGMWMLLRSGMELGSPTRLIQSGQLRNAGALIIGLSTFQGEFDFGVPQFQLLYQPVLIAFAAGLSLVCARSLLGRWGALKALGIFYVVRGGLALIVGVGLGYTVPHFPLYAAEALLVEAAAFLAWRRPLRFALLSGALIGTVGLAAEWAWSHVWMPHPWPASLLPAAPLLALAAAVGGALLGARIAQSLARPEGARAALPALPAPAVALAGVAVLAALAFPLPRTGGDGTRATVVPTPAGPGQVHLAVRLDPPDAARGAQWFEVLSWQGRQRRRIVALDRTAPGRYVAAAPVPVGGNWKTMVRLAKGSHLMAAPVYLPPERSSHRAGVEPAPRSGPLTSDTFQLQREARGGPRWLTTLAYALLAAIVAGWVALTAWSLRQGETRLRDDGRRMPGGTTGKVVTA